MKKKILIFLLILTIYSSTIVNLDSLNINNGIPYENNPAKKIISEEKNLHIINGYDDSDDDDDDNDTKDILDNTFNSHVKIINVDKYNNSQNQKQKIDNHGYNLYLLKFYADKRI